MTSLVLVTTHSAGLVATIRSRCQLLRFPVSPELEMDPEEAAERAALDARFEGMTRATLPDLLDWAEEYRGSRADAALRVEGLLMAGSDWLRARVKTAIADGDLAVRRELDAFQTRRAGRIAAVDTRWVSFEAVLTDLPRFAGRFELQALDR